MTNDPSQSKRISVAPMDLALWRYGIISLLLNRDPSGMRMKEILEDLSRRPYLKPDGTPCTLSSETIRKWLYRYRVGGLAALENRQRSDAGRFGIDSRVRESLFALRQEHPRWKLSIMFEELIRRQRWDG